MTEKCLYCERTPAETPLIAMRFQNEALWICPQHLPILIHKPEQLADKLPGLQILPGEHHHH